MTSAALLPLLFALQAPQGEEAVRLSLNPRTFIRFGEPVRVSVQVARDGFLTVFRADTRGRMHVVFPVEPGDESFVRGGERFRIYGYGGREAFAAFEPEGEGTVLAALSDRPYDFGALSYGNRWSERLMGFDYAGFSRKSHVEALSRLVDELAGGAHVDYAVVTYRVWGHDGFYRGRYLSQNACYGFGYGLPAFYGYGYGYRPYQWWSYYPLDWSFYGAGFYGYYDPFTLGYGYYDPFACSRFGGFFPRTGVVVVIPTRAGVPVDRDGFTRKVGDIVKPLEPRRREPGTTVATGGRTGGGDVLPVKRPRVGDEITTRVRDRHDVIRRETAGRGWARDRVSGERGSGKVRDDGRVDMARPRDRDRDVFRHGWLDRRPDRGVRAEPAGRRPQARPAPPPQP
ncbi:MAG: DUF4384 domain-containing protein, partial [Gemmatimonadales bacterium]